MAQLLEPPRSLRDRIRSAGLTSWAIIGIVAVAFSLLSAVLWVMSRVSVVFAPIAIAVITTYLLNPLVGALQRRGMRRGLAVLIVWLVFIAIVVVAMRFLVPIVVSQIDRLIENLPDYAERLVANVNAFAERRGFDWEIDLSRDRVQELLTENRDAIFSVLGGVRSFAGQVIHIVITVLIGLVLSIYLLVDLPKIADRIKHVIPRSHRDEVLDVGRRIGDALGGFFRGQLFVALFVGVASSIALTIVKVPFAVVIGIIAGIFNLVPLIGPFIGAIPAVVLSLLSDRPIRALWAALALLVVQQVDNHLISPNVMGRTVQLHPITVMLALLIGGTLAGIFGMLITIPIVASVKIVAAHLWSKREELGVTEGIIEPGTP